MVTVKRGRGRPKATVPPSPETLTNLKTPERESSNTIVVGQTSENTSRTTIGEDKAMTNTLIWVNKETLTKPIQPQPEERKP
ncbi:unnamed protein product [Lathyrus sativus]|nr:unnamed protein product [Lathyrus sativus]